MYKSGPRVENSVYTTSFVPNSLLVVAVGLALHFFSSSEPKRQLLPGVLVSLRCPPCEGSQGVQENLNTEQALTIMFDSSRTRGGGSPVGRKARKAGFRRGTPSFFACHGVRGPRGDSPAMTFDGFSVCGCMHFLLGAKRCLFWTWHSWPPNVSRHDVVLPSKVPYSTTCLCLLSSPLYWTLTFGPSLHATDASPSGDGACSTPVSRGLWTLLYDFSDEKGCSVRLDWDTSSMPPPELRDSRAAVAGSMVDLSWV